MQKYSVYVIKCDQSKFYIGLSSNVERRIDAHNKKLSTWTKKYDNWKLIYRKDLDNYTEARKWELYLKKQKGGENFKVSIWVGEFPRLQAITSV